MNRRQSLAVFAAVPLLPLGRAPAWSLVAYVNGRRGGRSLGPWTFSREEAEANAVRLTATGRGIRVVAVPVG